MKYYEYADYMEKKLNDKGIEKSAFKNDLEDLLKDFKKGNIKKDELDKKVFGVEQIRRNFKSYDLPDLKYYQEKK